MCLGPLRSFTFHYRFIWGLLIRVRGFGWIDRGLVRSYLFLQSEDWSYYPILAFLLVFLPQFVTQVIVFRSAKFVILILKREGSLFLSECHFRANLMLFGSFLLRCLADRSFEVIPHSILKLSFWASSYDFSFWLLLRPIWSFWLQEIRISGWIPFFTVRKLFELVGLAPLFLEGYLLKLILANFV